MDCRGTYSDFDLPSGGVAGTRTVTVGRLGPRWERERGIVFESKPDLEISWNKKTTDQYMLLNKDKTLCQCAFLVNGSTSLSTASWGAATCVTYTSVPQGARSGQPGVRSHGTV